MKKTGIICFISVLIGLYSCEKNETALEILHETISTIDTIRTIYYKQDMMRTDPGHVADTIFRHREMYFKRLPGDSIVGVKGHWYMYVDDKVNVVFEDIYDGNRLIRKDNRDSAALICDLIKYPEFRTTPFWGHNTLYGMQYSLKYMLDNTDSYKVERLNDTIFMNKRCFQILVQLEDKMTMPGFAAKLEDHEGNVSTTLYVIDKRTYYPIRMKGENFSVKNPEQRFFIDQTYYDIQFNIDIEEHIQFNTSDENLSGYRITERKPSQ